MSLTLDNWNVMVTFSGLALQWDPACEENNNKRVNAQLPNENKTRVQITDQAPRMELFLCV